MTNAASTAGERVFDEPLTDAVSAAFWKAAGEGVFRIKRCLSCAQPHWYPRALCPYCMGETAWIDASGRGSIYSVSVMRRAEPAPYAIAYVQLDEGVTVMTNIVDCDPDALRIGDRVRVTFKTTPKGAAVPMFTPDTD